LPFLYNEFIQKEELPAFVILLRHYNIALKEAQKIIDLGRMLCNGEVVTIKNKRISGKISVLEFSPSSRGLNPIFTTPHFLLFDKPSGVLVHPKNTKTPYSLLDEIRYFGGAVANPVHRIDMETSGLVLASKDKITENFFKVAFEQKQIQKSYLAWVRGNFKKHIIVNEPIKTRNIYTNSKHKVEINENGKEAKTEFKKLFYDAKRDISLIEAIPHTGRTHQIRIHLFHVKHPILGDPLYGTDFEFANRYLDGLVDEKERVTKSGAKRLLLHANKIAFDFKGNRYILKSKIDFKEELEKALTL
jgi:23S rRNA pseudouridine1911/1915/1917 synthase